jgi:uncharacterized BrkB/YihY/UPF0761 family membrane protein
MEAVLNSTLSLMRRIGFTLLTAMISSLVIFIIIVPIRAVIFLWNSHNFVGYGIVPFELILPSIVGGLSALYFFIYRHKEGINGVGAAVGKVFEMIFTVIFKSAR